MAAMRRFLVLAQLLQYIGANHGLRLAESPIPNTLHLTGKEDSIDQMSPALLQNLHRQMKLNSEMRVNYMGDKDCREYLKQHYSNYLQDLFDNATVGQYSGAYRGDICRAAVLLREGGFYMDADLELTVPLRDLLNASTTFMSIRMDVSLVNALMAAEPNSPILNHTLERIPKWYSMNPKSRGWLGPTTLTQGLMDVANKECRGQGIKSHKKDAQWQCGSQQVRLHEERYIKCDKTSAECPEERVQNVQLLRKNKQNDDHLLHGLFEAGALTKIVGWSRFASCGGYGCGGTGYAADSTN